jgi:hypothetical protein
MDCFVGACEGGYGGAVWWVVEFWCLFEALSGGCGGCDGGCGGACDMISREEK